MEQRLIHIPEEFHGQHLFCLWLYDQMLSLSNQVEKRRAHWVRIELSDLEREAFSASTDKHRFLVDNGHEVYAKKLALNSTIVHLYWDMYQFVLQGLKALERRHYTFAFATLRKPLKYSMMFATWICADPDDFYERLKQSPSTLLKDGDHNLSKARRRELIDAAVGRITTPLFSGEVIYNAVFDHRHPNGLAGPFDKASHLVTNRSGIETEDMNLNFIFLSPNTTHIYEGVYFPVAMILSYLLLLQLALLDTMTTLSHNYTEYVKLGTISMFCSLFTNANDDVAFSWINKIFEDVLTCSICENLLSVTKDNCVILFQYEKLTCSACGSEQPFPLFWLMARLHLPSIEKAFGNG